MAFQDTDTGSELSEEAQADNDKYGQLMVLIGEGNSLQGIYRGVKEVPGYEGKGKQKCHSLEQESGEILKVRGFGLMDHIIAKDVEEGQLIRVTYTGKGTDGYHKCKVAIDDGEGEAAGSGEEEEL